LFAGARALIADGFARWSAAIGDGLRALQTAGHLPGGTSPDDLAMTLLAALQGGLLLAQVQRDTVPSKPPLTPSSPSPPPGEPGPVPRLRGAA
jgi:hypothetical protein